MNTKQNDIKQTEEIVLDEELELNEDQKFAAKVLKKYADYVRKDAIER